MLPHTLIPDVRTYGLAIFIVYTLGGIGLAAHMPSFRLKALQVGFFQARICVLGFAIFWGMAVFGPGVVPLGAAVNDPLGLAMLIAVGALVGGASRLADRAILRWLYRRKYHLKSGLAAAAGRAESWRQPAPSYRQVKTTSDRSFYGSRPRGLFREIPDGARGQDRQLPMIMAVAGLEEILFRGVVIGACRSIPNATLEGAGILGMVLLFAGLHVQFGPSHVASKLPLGALATGAVLATNSVLPAICAHVLFNMSVWHDRSQIAGAKPLTSRL
jgi:hypothetical protein